MTPNLAAYGIGTEGDPWAFAGAALPAHEPAPRWDWLRRTFDPRPFPLPRHGSLNARTMEFDPARGDRPVEPTLFGADDSTAPSADETGTPAPEDLPPRIVAVLPHRGDHTITDEILARMAETEAQTDEEPAVSSGVPNLFGLIGSAQAQSRASRGSRPELTPAQHAQLRYFQYLQRQIRELDENNRELTSIQPEGYIPPWEELRRLEGVLETLKIRTAEQERIKQGGETLQTIIGDAAHRDYPNLFGLGDGWRYNRTFPSGNRPDAVHNENAEIREPKPNNEQARRRGEEQLRRYAEEYARLQGKPATTKLDLYDFYELLKRYLGISRGGAED